MVAMDDVSLPPWFQLAWWSFRTFVTFERPAGDGVVAAPSDDDD
jgi:hypothetical protein